jgi:hypothetical protein
MTGVRNLPKLPVSSITKTKTAQIQKVEAA